MGQLVKTAVFKSYFLIILPVVFLSSFDIISLHLTTSHSRIEKQIYFIHSQYTHNF